MGCSSSSATVAGRTEGCPDNGEGRKEYKKLQILFIANKWFVTKGKIRSLT